MKLALCFLVAGSLLRPVSAFAQLAPPYTRTTFTTAYSPLTTYTTLTFPDNSFGVASIPLPFAFTLHGTTSDEFYGTTDTLKIAVCGFAFLSHGGGPIYEDGDDRKLHQNVQCSPCIN